MKLTHLRKTPAAPTQDQVDQYLRHISADHFELGLQYHTGPRRGQQMAEARKA